MQPDRRRLRRALAPGFGIVALAFALNAASAEVAGVQVEDKATVAGRELVLNGAGLRRRAIFKVYVASLYLPEKARDLAGVLARSPRRVRLDLLRDLSAEQLVDAMDEGLRDNNSEAELAAVKPQVGELATIMRRFGEVHEKDVVTLDYADGATRVAWNGEVKGTIAGEAFNRALMRVWLGERPVQGELKRALLGG